MVMQARRRKPTASEILRCKKVLRHRWDAVTQTDSDATLDLLCDRCTTERHDWIDPYGTLTKRRYKHPDGYKDTDGGAALSMEEARLLLLRELTIAAGKPRRRR